MKSTSKKTAFKYDPKWSKYQVAVFEFMRCGTGHCVVEAVAGSGKTTTEIEAGKFLPPGTRVVYMAFNKDIQLELEKRVTPGTATTTFHRYGLLACKAEFGNKVHGDDNIELRRCENVLPPKTKFGLIKKLEKLVSMAKSWLVDDVEGLTDLAYKYECTGNGTFPIEAWVRLAKSVLEMSKTPAKGGAISFDDMIWLPVVQKLPVEEYDVVFIDERQDLNKVQIELGLMAAGEHGRIVAVGDDKQAIYGFRGADTESMDLFVKKLKATVLPLSITYRCPLSVVRLAQTFVPYFEAAPSAIEGSVTGDVPEATMANQIAGGDFVLSRTNAPLVKACLAALRAGKKAYIRGRDIGKGLIAFVKNSGTYTLPEFTGWCDRYLENEIKKVSQRRNADELIAQLQDKISTLHELMDGCHTIPDLLNRLNTLFEDTAGGADRIMFSSTHKAKGLEADRVWLLATTYKPGFDQEESNLCYVAITRAKRDLFMVGGTIRAGSHTGQKKGARGGFVPGQIVQMTPATMDGRSRALAREFAAAGMKSPDILEYENAVRELGAKAPDVGKYFSGHPIDFDAEDE